MTGLRLLVPLGFMLVAAAAPAADLVPYQQYVLGNGLRVVVHEDHRTPKVAVTVWYHVGSMNELAGKSGFAHLYEHLMFNGSEHHDGEYFAPLRDIGVAAMNGATSFDQTFYYEVVPTGGLDRALWLESDRMGYMLGAITQGKLDAQRAVVENEKRTGENRPYALMDQHEAAGLFPENHPYYHPTIGSVTDLDAASLADVKSWFRQYYGAANTVVTLAGDVTPAQGKALVERYFGSIPAGPPVTRMTSWVPRLAEDKTEVMKDDVPQTAVAWTWPVPGRGTPEAAALRVAADVLGTGRTSRLYRTLVDEQHLATSATANYQGYAVAGIFSIDLRLRDGVDPALAERSIDAVLRDYLRTGPTPAELARVKTVAYGELVREMESITIRAMALADGATFAADPGRFEKDERAYQAVSAADAAVTAKDWLGRPHYQLTVLPYGAHSTIADVPNRAVMPAAGAAAPLALPRLEEARLANGIRVRFVRREGTPLVDLAMVFDGGRAAEPRDKRGLDSFAVAMIGDGPEGMTAQSFQDRQAALGLRFNAYGSLDRDTVRISALTRNLPASIALWAQAIRDPGFRAEDIEHERTLGLAAVAESLTDPNAIADRTFSFLLYGQEGGYGVALGGRDALLRGFTRDDLVRYHDSWMRPDNAVILAAGDTDLTTLVALLNQAFGSWHVPAAPKGVKRSWSAEQASGPRLILVDKPGAGQSAIRVGQLVGTGLDAGNFTLNAMNEVLGGSFTSRLNMNLREKRGWTYGVGSEVVDARGPQLFEVATAVQTDKTAAALHEIDREVRAIRKEAPVSAQELDQVVKGEVLALPGQLETDEAVVDYLADIDHLDRPYSYLTSLPGRYAGLSPAALTGVANTVLDPTAFTWVVVGDLSKIEADVCALKLGNVSIWSATGVSSNSVGTCPA